MIDLPFKLNIVSGPHGDECCAYRVEFKKTKITVEEFVKSVLSISQEWGKITFKVYDKNMRTSMPWLGKSECMNSVNIDYAYTRIKQIDPKYESIKHCEIDVKHEHNHSYGGWSNMDYTIYLKE